MLSPELLLTLCDAYEEHFLDSIQNQINLLPFTKEKKERRNHQCNLYYSL